MRHDLRPRLRRGLRLQTFLLCLLLSAPSYSHPPSTRPLAPSLADAPASPAPPPELLVVSLALGDRVLSDGLLAYTAPGGDVLLPLGELARALELAIEVRPAERRATGWFLAENRAFTLDLPRGEAWVEGEPAPFDPAAVTADADELYVATDLLTRWLPLDFEVDLARLRVTVRSLEKLPLERRLERRRRWSRHAGAGVPDERRFPRQETPYRLLDWPAVDLQLSAVHGAASGTEGRLDLLAAGDLLGFTGELALGLGSETEAAGTADRAALFTLGRSDPEGRLLGPLGARTVRFGSFLAPETTLVAEERAGWGFEISSFPLARPREFTHTSFSGRLLPGWEVELLHNGQLVDFATAGEDGRYRFTEVPLLYGFNLFRFVFHGPQGQRRERVERVTVGEELARPGSSYYRLLVADVDRPFEADREAGARGGGRVLFELERSLAPRLSLRASFESLPRADGRHHYPGVGLRGAAAGIFASADLVADDDGGLAGRLAASTRVGPVTVSGEHLAFSGFDAERNSAGSDPWRRRSRLRGELRLPSAFGLRRASLGIEAASERHRSGAGLDSLSARLAASTRRLSASHRLTATRTRGPLGGGGERVEGTALARLRVRAFALRGRVGYRAAPEAELSDLGVTVDRRIGEHTRARLSVRRGFTAGATDAASLALDRRFARFTAGIAAGISGSGAPRVTLRLSTSLLRDPAARRLRVRNRPAAARGAAAARVFLDRDMDGRLGRGDEPLPGVRVEGGRPAVTGEDGVAFLPDLDPAAPASLAVDEASLEDPYWIPRREGADLLPRPGRVAVVDLPVVESGEVEGWAWLEARGGRDGDESEDARRPAARVRLQLVDAGGEVAAETESVFDGFFLFTRLAPGTYHLRVDPEQLERLGLASTPPRRLEVAPGAVVDGIEITLGAPAPLPGGERGTGAVRRGRRRERD